MDDVLYAALGVAREAGDCVIRAAYGQSVDGRALAVNEARPKEDRGGFNGGRGSGGDVVSRLARPAPGRRLRIQPQVGGDLLDDWPLEDGG